MAVMPNETHSKQTLYTVIWVWPQRNHADTKLWMLIYANIGALSWQRTWISYFWWWRVKTNKNINTVLFFLAYIYFNFTSTLTFDMTRNEKNLSRAALHLEVDSEQWRLSASTKWFSEHLHLSVSFSTYLSLVHAEAGQKLISRCRGMKQLTAGVQHKPPDRTEVYHKGSTPNMFPFNATWHVAKYWLPFFRNICYS